MTEERYPLDIEKVTKGFVLTVDEVERINRTTRGSKEHGLGLLKLQGWMESELEGRGCCWVIKQESEGLRVLTDAEASTYQEKRRQEDVRSILRGHRKLLHVDANVLTDEERAEHNRRVLVGGYFVQALAHARKQVRSLAHKKQEALPG